MFHSGVSSVARQRLSGVFLNCPVQNCIELLCEREEIEKSYFHWSTKGWQGVQMEMIGFSGLAVMIGECKERNKCIVIYTRRTTEKH